MPLTSRLFAVCPRVRKVGGRLIASTDLWVRLLTLGTLYREVVVDPKQEVIRLRRRYGWLFKRTLRIPFGSVRAVTYGYSGTGSPRGWWWGAYNTSDAYRVGLRLANFEEFHL